MEYCEDCGCKVFSGKCTNCHEELYIEEQYIDQDMKLPNSDSEFMKKVNKQRKEVDRKLYFRYKSH